MYNAEVLSKFPVVQHFPFGSLFSWEQDSNAVPALSTIHTSSQPTVGPSGALTARPSPQEGTRAPWAQIPSRPASSTVPTTRAPWANASAGGPSQNGVSDEPTKSPWAAKRNP